jgi:23S rRNA pseudouridine2604 synthase
MFFKKEKKLKNHPEEITDFPMRLNRFMALRGLATRRGADELIAAGLVRVDGRVARVGERIESPQAIVELTEGAGMLQKDYIYIAYYKPRGIITHSPKRSERSIQDISKIKGVFPVGRLDKDSEGLIILTNDGRVTERLLSPRFEHEKEYLVSINEHWPRTIQQELERGIEENGEKLHAKKFLPINKNQATIVLTEGKKHEIRRMLAYFDLSVNELRRVRIMNVHVGSLRPGEGRELSGRARAGFLKDLGLN